MEVDRYDAGRTVSYQIFSTVSQLDILVDLFGGYENYPLNRKYKEVLTNALQHQWLTEQCVTLDWFVDPPPGCQHK